MATKPKVIVTGGLGFIGANLVEALYSSGVESVVIDSAETIVYPSARRLQKAKRFERMGLRVIHGDALYSERHLRDFGIQHVGAIVNASALPGQRYSWNQQSAYYRNNLEVAMALARLASKNGLHLIQLSTSSVYGEVAVGDEDTEVCPISPYGHSKYAAEVAVRHEMDPDNLSILRLFSVYGPGQRDDMALHRLIESGLNGTSFTVFGDGTQTRTPTFVGDVVDAIITALELRLNGLFNVGGGESCTLREIIDIVEASLHVRLDLTYADSERGDQKETYANFDRFAAASGWRPTTPLIDGINRQITSLLSPGSVESGSAIT